MAHHRTPQELLAEALNKVEALRTKVAETNLKNHPRMASLLKRERDIKVELTKAAKWLDPEKGLEMRIAKLTSQIAEAEHKLVNAEDIKLELSEQLDNIKLEKTAVAEELSNDGLLDGC
jgi:chromosome segregation ATPase